MVVGSEEMENADNGCFMPIISSEKDSEIFFFKLSGTELLLIAYLNNISDNTKYYNRIVFEFEYALKEEDKQCLIENEAPLRRIKRPYRKSFAMDWAFFALQMHKLV
ncbi:hypothetical protein HpHA227_17950 [Helicobacter pylori]